MGVKISDLTLKPVVDGTEEVEIRDGSSTLKTTTQAIADLADSALNNGNGTTANGSAVDLGGDVSASAVLDIGPSGAVVIQSAGDNDLNISIGQSGINIGTSGSRLFADQASQDITFTDERGSPKGFVYAADYSATMPDLAMIHKGYVDDAIAGVGSGTVTSVGLTLGTSGSDLSVSGSPITGSGSFTLNVPDANAGVRGVVSTGTQTFNGIKTFSAQIQGSISGSAGSADTWTTPRTISTIGDATGISGGFSGSGNATIPLTLATVNSNVGSFGSTTLVPVITVNGKGLVTAVSTATVATSGTAWQLTGTSTLNAPILDGSYATHQNNSLGGAAVANSGIRLENNTAAAVNAQQVSPAITWKGFGWKSDATTASRSVEFRVYVLPQQSAVNPTGLWSLQSSINGAAFANCITVNNAGNTSISGLLSVTQSLGSNQKLITATASAEVFSVTQEGLVTLATTGSGLRIKEGSNASMGVVTLVGGTATISNTRVTSTSRIFLTIQGGTLTNVGSTYVSAKSVGTSFTISSTNALDTCDVAWMIIEPAP